MMIERLSSTQSTSVLKNYPAKDVKEITEYEELKTTIKFLIKKIIQLQFKDKNMDALLISYTTVDFRTKTEMELALRRWDANKEKWLKKFKAAGMVSNINTQIWNKEGVFRIGRIFMYKDEKSFVACQKIFREFENENSDINRKISSSRGIVLDENILI